MLLWLALLATGGGLLLSRSVRAILNDELTLANRARAIQAGFWTAMAATLALYFFSFARPLPVREALRPDRHRSDRRQPAALRLARAPLSLRAPGERLG